MLHLLTHIYCIKLLTLNTSSFLTKEIFVGLLLSFIASLIILLIVRFKQKKSKKEYSKELLRLENNVNNLKETKNNLNNQLTIVAALISHDLRAPLNKIKGLNFLISESDEKKDIVEYVGISNQIIDNQLSFLKKLLDDLKSEALLFTQEEKENIKLGSIVDDVEEFLNDELKKKNITLKKKFNTEEYIFIKKDIFNSVIINLITNAIKFSYVNSFISIELEKDQEYSIIHIIDNGKGFTKSAQDRLFDKFTDTIKVGTEQENPTGLGLYITKKIVEKHGGCIEAFSDGVNKGAKFTVKIPYLKS